MTKAYTNICGFMVVRLPQMNFDPGSACEYDRDLHCIGPICYAGIDRMAWFDVDQDYYAGRLPAEIGRMRQVVRDSNPDHTGIYVCRDIDVTTSLLQYSNRNQQANEVIAIRSIKLLEIKGAVPLEISSLDWLGYDVVAAGAGPILRYVVFASPPLFTGWADRVNEFGLLTSETEAAEFIAAYRAEADKGHVHEIFQWACDVDTIEVARVRLGQA